MGRHDNIMNVERYKASDLKQLFKRRGILLMSEMKKALGTQVDMTVFRKLKDLSYRTSYSHGGRYYTLEEIAQFDERGLWNRSGILLFTARDANGDAGGVRQRSRSWMLCR